VVSINDNKEQLILSKRAVDSERAWEDLQVKFDNREVFEVTVSDVVKGGLVVDLGVRAFIPASMVERHFVEDFSDYKGKKLRVRIKELDREGGKVILSQKDVLDEEYEQHKQQVLSSLKEGDIIEGTVQRLTSFGAFVDVGGIDGLVHISEMDYKHVEHPSEVVKEGDQVKVKILKVNPETEKISLSIKAAKPGPWELAADQFKIGDIVTGTVRRLVSFGAFVEVAPGVEGLVHISQISHRHIGTPHEVLKEGQEVKVKILDMNIAEKRISLSIKETEEAPPAPPKPEKSARYAKDINNNENVSLNNQGLSLTLGERFGDKLNELKK
jgi:small subunit ribosomal protein S1